ncbi:YCF48-related protein [Abyssibacter sp.]|uniref:WD40/YVTN/BNR-like repeat-containing protein n=1 Tax=Abyssibacter sp. TaxID=2320200 RepID=UPI00321B6697
MKTAPQTSLGWLALQCRAGLIGAAVIGSATHASVPEGTAPAETAVNSVSTLLTDIVKTGDQYVAVGWRGHILRSDNARDWHQAKVPVNVLLTAVEFVDPLRGWVVGHDGVILHTTDGGEQWVVQQFNPGASALLDVMFFNASNGIAVGTYGAMFSTSDGGVTWIRSENALTDEGFHFNDLTRLGNGAVLVVGEFGTLAISTDAAATWSALDSPYDSSLFAAAPLGDRGAVIGGLRGNLFVTRDVTSGEWARIDNAAKQSIFGLTPLGDQRYAVAALNGTLQVLDGRTLKQLTLDKAKAGIPPAEPSGPPYVLVLTDDVDRELGAFVRALPLGSGLLTVGDAGVRYWR